MDTLKDIAAKINCHLKRIENDPNINARRNKLLPYWNTGACSSGRYVYITYISYQGSTALSKPDALTYLAWLDSGNTGRHYQALEAKLEAQS